jgi:aarF domain-containing kinase
LEQEFGTELENIFSFIDPVPAGAASIGQAHRAVLRESGEEVIVKVQYPDAAWQVPADIQCVGGLLKVCTWAGLIDKSAARLSYDDFARQFLSELDYKREKENLMEIYNSSLDDTAPYKRRGVVVPRVYEKLCTNQVITMSYLPGPKLEHEARRQLELLGIDTTKRIGQLVRRATKNEVEVDADPDETQSAQSDLRVTKNDNSWRESIVTTVGKIVNVNSVLWSIRVARQIMVWSIVLASAGIQLAFPVLPISWRKSAEAHQITFRQASRLALTNDWIDALFDVHGHQIFQLGLFNGDPHPGNIILNEENNQLGLIDFGQCKRLSEDERVRIARLILSVANNESDEQIATAFRQLNIRTKNDSAEFLAMFARLMFGPFEAQHMDRSWHRKLHAMDRVTYFPTELSMVYRTSLLLRGLALSLQTNASISEQWRKHAQAALDRYA